MLRWQTNLQDLSRMTMVTRVAKSYHYYFFCMLPYLHASDKWIIASAALYY